MRVELHLSRMAVVAALITILLSGCASSPVEPRSSQGQTGIFIEQVPITSYMRSQVGTPNELSPLAPGLARNVHKVGDRWFCELDGQVLGFNSATSCWEPQR